MHPTSPRFYAKLVLMSVLWSGVFPASRVVLAEMPLFTATFLRFWFAALILCVLVVARSGTLPRLAWRDAGLVVAASLVGIAAYNICFNLGLARVEASRAALIVPTNPAVIAVFAALVFREPLGGLRAAGVALSVAGALWVLCRGDPSAFLRLDFHFGEWVLVAALFLWAAYTLIGRLAVRNVSPLVFTAYGMLIGALVLALPAAVESASLAGVSWQSWALMAYLVVFGTVVPFVWYYQGVQAIGAARASQFVNLVPPLAVMESIVLLGEPSSPALLVGGALVVAGLYLTNRAPRGAGG